ncbi:MAG: hypothetical protein ABSF69_13070 [Polyangiaceae bacterium]
MTFRAPHPAVIALFALPLATGCSSKKTEPPMAYVNASISNPGGGTCNNDEANFLVIGSDQDGGPSNPTRVGSGPGVTVTCSVSAGSNGTFILNLFAQNGLGSATITGSISANGGGPMDIEGSFYQAGGGTYQQSTCSITFVQMPAGGPVAVGRVWGQIDCPMATLQGSAGVSCDVSAEFVFENCLTE